MWRWSVLVCVILLFKYISPQPISDSPNDRPPRQLDFEDCCPCFDRDEDHDARPQDAVADGSASVLARAGDLDDCPCRGAGADAQGAPSVFFPTAMRAAGSFLRPTEKKEDLKPLFNPEVDLASSVLQTLREVTDEEYQDALARDAAKSAKAAEDILFGDATPQESANLVTIVVNPSLSEDDDVIPQASHIQQSRCIHPLQSTNKLRMATKPNLFVYKPRLPKAKSALFHKAWDNGVGASSLYENVVPFNEDFRSKDTDVSPLRVLDSLNVKNPLSPSTGEDDCDVKTPDFKTVPTKPQNLDLNKSPLIESLRNKIDGILSRTPKMLKPVLKDDARDSGIDLSSASSIINEQTPKKIPHLRTNSVLESIKQKSRPLSLTNLLNLKDVEIVPAKDLINKIESDKINRPKFTLPSVMHTDERSLKKDGVEFTNNLHLVSTPNTTEDIFNNLEVSPSNINIQTSSRNKEMVQDDCDEGATEFHSDINARQNHLNTQIVEEQKTDVLDTLPDGENEVSKEAVNEKDCTDNESNESNNINNIIEQENPKQITNIESFENQHRSSDDPCDDEEKDHESIEQDSATGASNNINNVIEQQNPKQITNVESFENQHRSSDDPCDDEEKDQTASKEDKNNGGNTSKLNLLDLTVVDKTISNIKENIAKKLEDLKNFKNSIKNKEALGRSVLNNNDNDNMKDLPVARNENLDCQDDASIQITTLASDITYDNTADLTTTVQPSLLDDSEDLGTPNKDFRNNVDSSITLKPDPIDDNTPSASECADKAVSLEELQKLSDAMLQQEERDREQFDCNKNREEIIEQTTSNYNGDTDLQDLDKSADTIVNVTKEPVSNINLRNNEEEEKGSEQGACKSNLVPKDTSLPLQTDNNVDASEVFASSVPKSNDILSSPPVLQPTLNLFKKPLPDVSDLFKLPPLDPLPSIEDIKVKLTNIFDKNNRDTENIEKISPLESKAMFQPQDDLNPVMTSAASTSSFQSRVPSSKLLEEINFKGLNLKPQTSFLPQIPNIDLKSTKTKLPVPKDLSLKPIKTQTVLDDRQRIATSSIGQKTNIYNDFQLDDKTPNIFKEERNMIPRIGDFKSPLSDSPTEATHHIHSTLRNTQRAFKSKLRKANKNLNLLRTPIKSSSSLLDSLSRNHEDISDKLKGLQMDLNDRLETMRNELNDRSKLLTSGSRNSKPSFNNIGNQKKGKQPLKYTWKASSARESQKMSSSRKPIQQKSTKIISPPKINKQSKFRMPGAASVPVPSTVQVPELKRSSENLTPITVRQDSPIVSKWNTNIPQIKETDSLGRLSTNSQRDYPLLRKPFGMKKDSKITVSFSTTPRPVMMNKSSANLPRSSIGKIREELGPRGINDDYEVSPSEIKKTKVSPLVPNLNTETSRKSAIPEEVSQSSEMANLSNKSVLQSWPKATESSFLTKVREAVQTRLSKVNSSKNLKQTAIQDFPEKPKGIEDARESIDMTRSATENKEVIDEAPLKENVAYKCRMVCTKE